MERLLACEAFGSAALSTAGGRERWRSARLFLASISAMRSSYRASAPEVGTAFLLGTLSDGPWLLTFALEPAAGFGKLDWLGSSSRSGFLDRSLAALALRNSSLSSVLSSSSVISSLRRASISSTDGGWWLSSLLPSGTVPGGKSGGALTSAVTQGEPLLLRASLFALGCAVGICGKFDQLLR